MFEKTKAFCDSLLNMGVPGFDLAVFKGGKPILRYMNGYNDIEKKIKINGKERYNIYSARMLVRCDEDGKLYLYDLVRTKKETSSPPKQ